MDGEPGSEASISYGDRILVALLCSFLLVAGTMASI